MSKKMDKLIELNDLIATAFKKKHIIVLDPELESENKEELNPNITYDKAKWKVPENIKLLINELSQNSEISNEEKILLIYEQLCKDYVYDDNLISYIQKVDDDSYTLPDFYGRDVDEEWERNREQHNRRVCYEVSRYLAKSLKELFKDNEDFNISIFWDKSLTHYFVGLTCREYSITLDLDDFNNIKDLTRIKTGLTAEGIKILDDSKDKFKNALDRFNEGRSKDSIQKKDADNVISSEDPDSIVFLKYAIETLKDKYDIDSQGLYEYIKEIIDINLGTESRKKVWKEIKAKGNEETRYIRCLLLDVDEKKYIIDVEQRVLRSFDEEELKGDDREFIPYKELASEELINFRSRKENRYKGR